jgi:hypothetical protein
MFVGELVTCNDFGDDHDEITIARIGLISRRSICGYYLRRVRVLI